MAKGHKAPKKEMNEAAANAVVAVANRGDVAALRRLLAAHPEAATFQFEEEYTILMRVAARAPPAAIEALAAAGADLDAVSWMGDTPLIAAAMANNAANVQALLAAGANVDGCSHAGSTPLICAAVCDATAAAAVLIAGGADVSHWSNSYDGPSWTPLKTAAERKFKPMARMLLRAGALVETTHMVRRLDAFFPRWRRHWTGVHHRILPAGCFLRLRKGLPAGVVTGILQAAVEFPRPGMEEYWDEDEASDEEA